MNTRSGSTSKKRLKIEETTSNIEDSTIGCLNDYCLLGIFQYITYEEKMNLQLVCKNMNRVVKISMNQVKSLDLKKILPYKFIPNKLHYDLEYDIKTISKKRNINYLKKFLKKCGKYLTQLNIDTCYVKDLLSSRMLFVIPNYCHNLTDVILCEQSSKPLFTDKNLKILFSNNPNISSISMKFIQIYGDCLVNLNENNIKKLELTCIRVRSIIYPTFLDKFLKSLKNLNAFQFSDKDEYFIEKAIDFLILSECNNISEINIRKVGDFYFSSSYANAPKTSNLTSLLSKQKEIRKFELYNVRIDHGILEEFPTDKLEELSLKFNEYHKPTHGNRIDLSFLSKQKNIRKLKLKNVFVSENSIEKDVNTLKTIDLEELSVEFKIFPSKEANSNVSLLLSKIKKIHKLRFKNLFINKKMIENLPAEYIEELDLDFGGFEISEGVLKYIGRFKNLKIFKVLFMSLDNDDLKIITNNMNKNVKKIEIRFHDASDDYYPSIKQICNFSNLESLLFHNENRKNVPNFDYLFKDLSGCENLINLSIRSCEIKNFKLYNLKNLLTLELQITGIKDEEILSFIKKSLQLRELKFTNAYNVTNELIVQASEVKVKRGDTHVLKIFFNKLCTKIDFYEMKNAPLVNACHLINF